MVDTIVCTVAERLIAIIKEQIHNEIYLVRGVDREVLHLSDELKRIRMVLDDAEMRGFKDKNVKDWLKKLDHLVYEMDDLLDDWEIAILKLRMERESNDAVVAPPNKQKVIVCPSILPSCLRFKKELDRQDIANKILNVKEQLDCILKERDRYNSVISRPTADTFPESWRARSTSFVDLAEIHGRDKDKDILVYKLISDGGSREELGLHILSIVGMVGLGKTTLAQIIYNDYRVQEYFELRIWICVSNPFNVVEIAKRIIESVRKERCPDTNQLEILLPYLRESISGKKFLLILDDVWTQEYTKWEPLEDSLKCGGAGSKILVTTRNVLVAKSIGKRNSEIYHLGLLSDDDCWKLFSRIALFERNEEEFENFLNIGKEIANKCKGLPLAAKALGSLLHFRKSLEEWKDVLESEIWDLEMAEVEIFPHFLLSYLELSPTLKCCFSYCAFFPKDHVIDVESLIESWMALGYLGYNFADDKELKGRECFHILAMCSLFQDFEESDVDGQIKRCKMHDVVHDFAQFVRRNGRVKATVTMKTICQLCDPLLVSIVKMYRSLPCHYGEFPLCDCLAILRIFSLRGCGFQSMPHEIENFIHLKWLDLSEIKLSRKNIETICKLYVLQILLLERCELQEIPVEIRNLIHLSRLHLSGNDLSKGDLNSLCKLYKLQFLRLSSCNLAEIPSEIRNLSHLMHLDLSFNYFLRGIPDSICGLYELRTLNLACCHSFSKLPQEIHKLTNLKHLHNKDTHFLYQFPQGLGQLTALRTLTKFHGGSHLNKLGMLKDLNLLTGSLELHIRLTDDLVEDAREAKLENKVHIQNLKITFYDYLRKKESSLRMDLIDALKPHPNLLYLEIRDSNGSELPSWTVSLNRLRSIVLSCFNHLSSLWPLGELPCLEELCIDQMFGLQVVGLDFLGITVAAAVSRDTGVEPSSSTSSVSAATNAITGFPMLRKLIFCGCPNWKEWEDLTAEEESLALRLMPCLTELTIKSCEALTALPHRLLLKARWLRVLDISGSTQLQKHYKEKDGFASKARSKNPGLQTVW